MQVDRTARPYETADWALTVVGGPWAGTRLAWDRADMVVGRHAAGAALFRTDPAVSRRHAVLHVVDGLFVAEDLNSKNGTFVNEVAIDRPTVLGPEDELRIGTTRLRLAPALSGTALLTEIPAPDPEGAPWDERGDGGPAAPRHESATGTAAGRGRARDASRLALSILAAIAGTLLASALNGSPQLRLAAAVVGSAVPAFITEPGRHQRARVTAAVVLTAGALFVTYGGATLFSYATDHAAIYPVLPVVPPPARKPAPTPAPTGPAAPTPTGSPAATPKGSPAPTPTGSPTPTPTPAPPTPTPSGSPTPMPTWSPSANPAGP